MKKQVLTVLLFAGVLGSATLSGCGEKKIDLENYVEVTFDGLDKAGTATISFDSEGLASEMTGKGGLSKMQEISRTIDTIELTLNQDENLQNKDVVKAACKYDNHMAKQAGLRLDFDEMEFEVSGLEQSTAVSANVLLDQAGVMLEGVSPYGEAYIDNAENEYSDFVYYNLDKTDNIKNGDEIQLSLQLDELAAEYAGYAIVGGDTVKTLKVAELPEYASLYDDITQESQKRIKDQAYDVMESWKANNRFGGYTYSESVPVRIVFLYNKDLEKFGGDANILYLFFKTTQKPSGTGKAEDVYVSISLSNITHSLDGKNTFDLSLMDIANYDEKYEDVYSDEIQSRRTNYTISEYDF